MAGERTHPMGHARTVLLAVVAALLILPASAAAIPGGTTITVNTGDDGNTGCTLRAALKSARMDANEPGCTASGYILIGDDTVSIPAAVDPVITLDPVKGPLSMDLASGKVTIAGPGAGLVTVSGDDDFRVLSVVNGGAGTISGTISGITIAHGRTNDAGAGINSVSGLTLDGVVVEDNHVVGTSAAGGSLSVYGGGIRSTDALTIRNSTIRNNSLSATVSGGSPMGFNTATASGGGIYYDAGYPMMIEATTVSGNSVHASATGGMLAADSAQGGGVQVSPGGGQTVEIKRTTISGNSASSSIGAAGAAGVSLEGPDTTLQSTTIASNTAHFDANARLQNTTSHSVLIADPLGGGDNCADVSGNTDQGFNLEAASVPPSCGFTSMFDINVADAGLGPLAANGGPTQTRALLPSSPAIDKGEAGPMETADQRGQPRPFDFTGISNTTGGDGSDIGAFELQPACAEQTPSPLASCPPPQSTGGSTTGTGTTGERAAALKKCKKKKSKKARKRCKKKAKKLPA